MRKTSLRNRSVGVKKEFDNLNRIVIPKEMRELYGFEKEVEMIATPEGVLIRNPEWRLIRVLRENK